MTEDEVGHLHRQLRASVVQGKEIMSWILPSGPKYTPKKEDYDVPWDPWPTRSYGLTELHPGDEITIVGEFERIDGSNPTSFFCRPDYIYPFPFRIARSPFHGQGATVLRLALILALVPFLTLTLLWSFR